MMNKFIEKHKMKFQELAVRVDQNLRQMDNIEISVLDRLSSLMDLPENAIIYANKDADYRVIASLNHLNLQFNIINDNISTEVIEMLIQEFNDKKVNYIISSKPLAITRNDLRAVIFFGMPETLDKLWNECLKIGRDGNPSKCIVYYSENHMDYHLDILDERCKNDREFTIYCHKLLKEVMNFCKTKDYCRRWMIRKYFNTNIECNYELRESCCDNCSNILLFKSKLHLFYENGPDELNKFDFSDDIRILISIFIENDEDYTFDECIKILHGIRIQKYCSLKCFGAGRHRNGDYWKYVFDIINGKFLCNSKVISEGMKFYRRKTEIFTQTVNEKFCDKFLKKKNNIKISVINGKFISTSQIEKSLNQEDVDEFEGENSKLIFLSHGNKSTSIGKNEDGFNFGIQPTFTVRKRAKLEQVKEREEKEEENPKIDRRDALAAAMAQKTHNKSNNYKSDQAGCSHWFQQQQQQNSISNGEFNDSLRNEDSNESDTEQEIDAYITNTMTSVRKKPLDVPLIDLLDYIENATSDIIEK